MEFSITKIADITAAVFFIIECLLTHIYFSFKSNRLGLIFPIIAICLSIILTIIAFPFLMLLKPFDPEPITKLFLDLNIPTFILLVIYFMCRTIVRKMEEQ